TRGERGHEIESVLDRPAVEHEVRLQEELGHPELRIAAHVLVDLLDRAEEGRRTRPRGASYGWNCPRQTIWSRVGSRPARSAFSRRAWTSGAMRSKGTLPPLKPSPNVTARRTAAIPYPPTMIGG